MGSFESRKLKASAQFESDLNALQVRYTEEKQRLSSKVAEQRREKEEQIEVLEVRRGSLQKEVEELQSQLSELKARAASIVEA